MENSVHAAVPLRVGKKMRKRRELDALVGGGGARTSRLLSASSDEGEPWGRRAARRRRSKPFVRLAAALALCVCVVSAATVLWLFVDVRRQIVSLRNEMDRVSTSSDSIGDALQGCHTAAKVLQSNATDLSNRLTKLEQEHLELAKRVEKAIGDLTAVSDQLAAAPKLADTPRRLAELQRTVADFGSQVKGFETSLQTAHNQLATASSGVEEMKTLLHKLETKTNETTANVTANMRRDQELTLQMAALNTTLGAKLDALRARIEVSQNASSMANMGVGSAPAPRPAPSAAPAAAPAPAAQPPPPPPPAPTPQGPQAKPSVLAANQ